MYRRLTCDVKCCTKEGGLELRCQLYTYRMGCRSFRTTGAWLPDATIGHLIDGWLWDFAGVSDGATDTHRGGHHGKLELG